MTFSEFSGIWKSGAMLLLAFLFMNAVNFGSCNVGVRPTTDFTQLNLPEYTNRPFYFLNRHFETIIPSILFRSEIPDYSRERIELEDQDFLDLDWVRKGNDRLIIISHGMEGDTRRHYVTRAANYFSSKDWDILAWNQRGCSGEINRLAKLTHHGSTDELSAVINHALKENYSQVVLLGFSMGGCQTLKYLSTHTVDDRVKGGIGFSVTFDFRDMMIELEKPSNRIYKKTFLSKLENKVDQIEELHPDFFENSKNTEATSFAQFYELYSLKMHGFKSLEEFYYAASPSNWTESVRRPMLVVNAQNDPFLGEKNYPDHFYNPLIKVEYPTKGGHLGFSKPWTKASYMEEVANRFITEGLGL